jgi:hypothetical protein
LKLSGSVVARLFPRKEDHRWFDLNQELVVGEAGYPDPGGTGGLIAEHRFKSATYSLALMYVAVPDIEA